MTEMMILRAERMVRHSRRFFMRLCAFCERDLGPAMAPASSRACEHGPDLLRLARRRARTLGRVRVAPGDGPEPTRPRAVRGRRSRAARAVLPA